MSKKRILFNLNTFPLVGNIVPLTSKIRYWQESGYLVTIFGSQKLIEKLKDENLLIPFQTIEIIGHSETTNKIKFMSECLRRNILSLKYIKEIEKQKFSIVYTISSVLDLVFIPALLKSRKNKFLWLTVFDNTVPFTGSGNKIVRFLNWFFFILSSRLIKKADRVFAPSTNVQTFLKERGFSSKQIIPTGNGVEVDLIKKAKRKDNINIDALYIGRINEAKGIYEMLKILEMVIKKFPKFQLAIMGDGDVSTVDKFKAAIDHKRLTTNIQFLGFKSGIEKYDIIKSSKCFWFFSEAEGFPQALMEAVSSGLKCFVYYLPAYEYYKNDELMVFDQKNYKDVAKSVINLFQKKDFKNQAGAALLEKFAWKRISELELESIN